MISKCVQQKLSPTSSPFSLSSLAFFLSFLLTFSYLSSSFFQGVPGFPGFPGEKGEMGVAGRFGTLGAIGPTGPKGREGLQGSRGLCRPPNNMQIHTTSSGTNL